MAKIFTKNTWTDESLAGAERYDIKENAGTPFKSNMQINLATSVAVAGSPVNASRMNNLENGVNTLDDALVTYTTGGTSTAFTLTTPQASALATTEHWRIIFNATAGATPTLNRDGKGAKALKYYDSTGAKVACGATTIVSGMIVDIVYDGTDYVVLTMGVSTIRETDYKVTPTVVSNNLTLTLTHADGTTPSTSRPLWFKIADSWRAVTAALSVTVNAGASSFAAGSAEWATKAIDYFTYVSWRAASSAVVLGLSRIPFATLYSNFSATATNELYGAFSTAPGSGDDVVNIGRFTATLSAGAGYTWTVPTFTSSNLIQRPVYDSSWMAMAAPNFTVATIDNGSGGQPAVNEYRCMISGRQVRFHISGNGMKAGAGTYFSFALASLPFVPQNLTGANAIGSAYNSDAITPGTLVSFTSVHFVFSDSIADNTAFTNGWGASGSYEI
jgi:hypothetical protein